MTPPVRDASSILQDPALHILSSYNTNTLNSLSNLGNFKLRNRWLDIGTDILNDLRGYGFSLLRMPLPLIYLVDDVTARADSATRNASWEACESGKMMLALPSSLSEPRMFRAFGLNNIDGAPSMQKPSQLELNLADMMHRQARVLASALLAANSNILCNEKDCALLEVAPYHAHLGGSLLRISVYNGGLGPNRKRPAQPPLAYSSHKDKGLLSLVVCHRADSGSGLEVLQADQTWLRVPLQDGIVAVLPGGALQHHINPEGRSGDINACEHKVLAPRDAAGRRISITFHLLPNPSAEGFGNFLEQWDNTHTSINVGKPVLPAALPEPDMNLVIRFRTTHVIPVRCHRTWTVGDLMDAIYIQEGICPGQQRLMYACKQLVENVTLAECNIHEGSNIELMLRLRGS
ncbi:hypothetical protein Vretifemale_2517 [Volvox reticuliferus]|nr:hypothetical protein Vretifemale_2517 [Volvox reticuliferus]